MKTTYCSADDILEIRVSDKPVSREVSRGWYLNVGYASDGGLVEVVVLEAKKARLDPALLEDLEDLRDALAVQAEDTVPWSTVNAELGIE